MITVVCSVFIKKIALYGNNIKNVCSVSKENYM